MLNLFMDSSSMVLLLPDLRIIPEVKSAYKQIETGSHITVRQNHLTRGAFGGRKLTFEHLAHNCKASGFRRGSGRVVQPFGVTLTDPSGRLSRTRLFLRFAQVSKRPPGEDG